VTIIDPNRISLGRLNDAEPLSVDWYTCGPNRNMFSLDRSRTSVRLSDCGPPEKRSALRLWLAKTLFRLVYKLAPEVT